MLRWLAVLVAFALASVPAEAQVFKPKGKKAAATQKAPKKAAKKQPRAATRKKKRVTAKKKKQVVREVEDDEVEAEPKGDDKDYVKIWDDEEIE